MGEAARSVSFPVEALSGVAQLGAWEWTLASDTLAWSEELFRIYGVSRERYQPSFLGYLARIHPADRERVHKRISEALRARETFSQDERILHPDGSTRWIHTWGKPVLDPQGHVLSVVGLCQDITERVEAADRLRESEARYRRIVETAEEGVWLLDENLVTRFVNRKMAEMLGFGVAEMEGRSGLAFLDLAHRAAAGDAFRRRREGERAVHDLLLRHASGRKVWVSVVVSPLFHDDGGYSGSLAMVSDVTVRRRNESLLTVQRNISDMLVRGRELNEALELLTLAIEGLSEGMLASILLISKDGRHLRTGAAPSLPPEFFRAFEGVEIGPKVGSCGTAAYRRELVIVEDIESDPLWADHCAHAAKFGLRACWSSPIVEEGEVLGTFALYFREPRRPSPEELQIVREFTAAAALVLKHVRLRDSLAESEALFRLLAEASADGIAIHEGGRLLVTNRAMETMLGYGRGELLGRRVLDLAAPEFRDLLAEKMKPGRAVRYSGQALRKDGTKFWAEVRGQDAVFRGRTVRLASIRDVTEERDLEETRNRMMERERIAREQAESVVSVREQFLAMASHELRTPLTPLRLGLQLVRRRLREIVPERDAKAELLAQALDVSDAELARLGRLINDLLDVTRLSGGPVELSLRPVNLAALARETIERHANDLRRAGCPLVLESPPTVSGRWDPLRLGQVLTKLLTNAMKYGKGAPIHVTLEDAGAEAILRVRDEGIGIAPEDQPRIFERFGRAAPTDNYGGLGLGLFVVNRLVAAHGGSIALESAAGKGATFTIRLPKGI